MTVLFADLVGFTSFAERLDAEDVATVQDAYFAVVRETVGRYGGRLEKFIGDAAMAVFGIPRVRDDDAERGVRTGLALVSAVEQLGTRLGLDEPSLQIRVGVNTGEVVVGASEALATGDTVNVAARFQTVAAPGSVLLGEATALSVENAIELQRVEPLLLKGKEDRTQAWRACAVRAQPSRDHAMGGLHAPLLGRDEDLRVLAGALADGVRRVVLVAPPGVGKTRLTTEFTAAVDAPILGARLRPDLLAPYQPVAQLLAAGLAAADIPVDEAAGRAAVRNRLDGSTARKTVVEDALAAVLWPGSGEESGRALAVDRAALFDAWLEGFSVLAGGRRPIWLVEDVHWAGGDLLAFLHAAGERGDKLVLATARPALLEQAEDWCNSALVHQLPPLSELHVAELVHALVGDALGPDVVDAIVERSDGNALFVEELLRTWISVGILVADDGGFHAHAETSEVALPTTVQAIYAAQIDDLPPNARQVARHAAVAGRRFPDRALVPLDVPEAAEGVAVLERRALVSAGPPDPLVGETHVFRHALLRDAGYASLSRRDRARLHVQLALWLESTAASSWAPVAEVIGRHYAAAVDASPRFAASDAVGIDKAEATRRAAAWFERAAGVALEVAAHDAARSLLRRALDLTSADAPLDEARRLELLGEATAFAADMEEGGRAMSAALDLYRAGGDRIGTARAGYRLGMIRLQQLRFADALQLADDLFAELGEREEQDIGLLFVLRAAASYSLTNDLERSDPDTQRALGLARQSGNEALEFAAIQWTVAFHSPEPRQLEGVDFLRTLELAERKRAWATVAAAHESRALLLIMTDRASEADADIACTEDVATTHGFTEGLAWTDYLRCEQGLLLGDWDEAVAAGIRAIELADRNGYTRAAVRTWMPISALAHARCDVPLTERLADWITPRAPLLSRVPSPFARLMWEAMMIRNAEFGVPIPRLLREPPLPGTFAVRFRQPAWFAAADTVFSAFVSAGGLDDADEALDAFSRRNREWSSSMSFGFESLLRARLLAARNDHHEEEAVRALEYFQSIRAPWWEAKTLRLLGRPVEAAEVEQRLGVRQLEGRRGA